MDWRKVLLYNLWYYQKPPWDSGISPPELMEFIRQQPPGRALDLGCGTGTNAITLAMNGWQATGVDFAWRAIHLARRKAKKAGVQPVFRVGDVTRLRGVSGSFDLILDIGCFHSLPEDGRMAYRDNIARLLAPGGTLLLYAFLQEAAGTGLGISEADIEGLASGLQLLARKEGDDRAGSRRSAWLTFQKG